MNCLVVVEYPDDDVLGACGAMNRMLQRGGDSVYARIPSGNVLARTCRPSDEELRVDIDESMKLLAVACVRMGAFPNIQLHTVPYLLLVQIIEKTIVENGAERVITHPSDTVNTEQKRAGENTVALNTAKVYIDYLSDACLFTECNLTGDAGE